MVGQLGAQQHSSYDSREDDHHHPRRGIPNNDGASATPGEQSNRPQGTRRGRDIEPDEESGKEGRDEPGQLELVRSLHTATMRERFRRARAFRVCRSSAPSDSTATL